MPFDSQGKFTRMHSWEQDRIDDIDIVTDHHDEEDDNFAVGLNECFLRNGRTTMQADLDAGNFKIVNVGNGSNDKDAVNKEQLDELLENVVSLLNSSFVVGDIKSSALMSDHNNWLLCNGRAVLRTDYEDLFAAIGTAFGEGDGSTTFNIPDCRGLVLRGLDNGRGADSGRVLGSYQQDGAPNISGNFTTAIGSYHDIGVRSASGAFSYTSIDSSNYNGYDDQVTMQNAVHRVSADASRSSAVYGRAGEIRMKNIAVNYFIKVKGE